MACLMAACYFLRKTIDVIRKGRHIDDQCLSIPFVTGNQARPLEIGGETAQHIDLLL